MLLKKGSSGHQVVELQEGLEALGYELGSCDGAFGPATEKAVKAFQTAENLRNALNKGLKTLKTAAYCAQSSKNKHIWGRLCQRTTLRR